MIGEQRGLIASYGAQQALEDGVLREPYQERWPRLLISLDVHLVCLTQVGRTYDEALIPLLGDCVLAAQAAVASGGVTPPLALEHTVAGTVWIAPNELGGMTVYTPEEE